MHGKETIFALSSGRPPAGISIIRLSGPDAHGAGVRIAGSLAPARIAAVRELRSPRSGDLIDRALVLRFDGPASSTGEDVVEFHCHGGRAVVDALLEALSGTAGLRAALPGEFTRRAFENGIIDLTEAEGLADLIEAETELQRKAALAVAEGALRRQVEQWRRRVLSISAEVEHAIDYDEEDSPLDGSLQRTCAELAREIVQWLALPSAEPLKAGVLVVVAGPPNAGKSSLINAIAGEDKAIVTSIPGTTRDSIEVPLSLAGVPIRLTDTAGLRRTDDLIESIGVERAARLAASADLLLWLGDPGHAPPHSRTIFVHSKVDLPEREAVPEGSVSVSSTTRVGLGALTRRIEEAARSILPADNAVALNRRQATLLDEASLSLSAAASTNEAILVAEGLRQARSAFDRLTGRAGVEDVLDEMFARFCLGK